MFSKKYDISYHWKHISFNDNSPFVETYGFSGSQGSVNIEGILIKPDDFPSKTLLIFMHPASTLQLLPMPAQLASMGYHVLCAGSRFAKNDTALIMEKVILDLGAYIREAKEKWGYEHIVLMGWSGGGSLATFYQSQAENPSIIATPAGDPVDVAGARLIPADAVVFQAAHLSRATMLSEWIDPSVKDELNPDNREVDLDIYNPHNPNKAPFTDEYLSHYRAAQLERIKKIREWVLTTLDDLKKQNNLEHERGFVTHRTMADPRFIDPTIEPNGRRPNWCYLGHPETVNNGPVGLGRFSTLRSWLSQWSIYDTNADGLACVSKISKPMLFIENQADDAVPQPHTKLMYDAAITKDKSFYVVDGANHYYKGQPDLLAEASIVLNDWLTVRKLL